MDDSPLHLSVIADIHDLGASVVYSVSADLESWLTGDGILVDFGGNNLLWDTPRMYLRIQNTSAIDTDFRLQMKSFPSAVPADKLRQEVNVLPTALIRRDFRPVAYLGGARCDAPFLARA